MLEGFLLSAAFVAGQSAVPAAMPAPPLPVRYQAAAPAAPAPAAPTPMKMPGASGLTPAPATSGTTYAPTTSGITYLPAADCPTCEPAAEEEEAPTYFFMNLFADRPLGQWMKQNSINIYGWTELSYNGSTNAATNAPVFMYDHADRWQLNQNWLHLDKTIDTSRKEFQLGGTADLILPGTDARTTIARNLMSGQANNSPNGGFKEYPVDLYQAYGEAFLPGVGPEGTTMKIGKFQTNVGYEMVQTTLTPFLGRSFNFQYNPFTHTGVMLTTPLNDTWTVMNGLALGSDNFIGNPSRTTYLGSLRWAPKDGSSTAQANVVVTDPTFDVGNGYAFYNTYNLVLTHSFNDNLSYASDMTYSHINGVPGIGRTDWYGWVNYMFLKHTDMLTSGFRFELFHDSDGFRTGTGGLYVSPTYGLTITPKDWLMLRPSVQYAYNRNAPFEGKQGTWIGAMDFIVRW